MWCESHAVSALPAAPETVAAYIAECAGRLKVGSIQRRLNAIAEAHKAVGLESPTSAGMVRNTLKGIRRTLGTAPAPKAPTLTDDIRARRSGPWLDRRARSGAGPARVRGSVSALGARGLGHHRLRVRQGRTHRHPSPFQDRSGRRGTEDRHSVWIESRDVSSPLFQAWIELAALSSGCLFRAINRHGQGQAGWLSCIDVARIVKKLAIRAGLDPAKYAGHSLAGRTRHERRCRWGF